MNDTRDELKRKINACNFVKNNGTVLRTINILRTKYTKLSVIQGVLEDDNVTEGEFLDCIHFLNEEDYIHLRIISTKDSANIYDYNYKALEAKLTGKGIRLLAGGLTDELVEV